MSSETVITAHVPKDVILKAVERKIADLETRIEEALVEQQTEAEAYAAAHTKGILWWKRPMTVTEARAKLNGDHFDWWAPAWKEYEAKRRIERLQQIAFSLEGQHITNVRLPEADLNRLNPYL